MPGFVTRIEVTCLSALITASAVDVVPEPVGPATVIVGIAEYPAP